MLWNILIRTYEVILESAPYIFFGAVVAGLLQALVKRSLVERWLAPKTFGSVVRAAVLGAPLPLCSCSVLPMAMQLRRSGATRGATSSFLISTPQTSVDSVLLSWGLLNPVFAIARVIGAVATGLVAGVVQNLSKDDPPSDAVANANCCSGGGCCAAPPPEREATFGQRLLDGQRYVFADLLPSLSDYYIIGFVITGILMAMLPEGYLDQYVGGGIGGMIIVAVIGLALYICASAATPMAAALVAKGMSPGTAFVLLLAGPATSLASMVAVKAMLGTGGLLRYLAAITVCAIAFGLFLDAAIAAWGGEFVVNQANMAEEGMRWYSHSMAIALILLMSYWSGKKILGSKIK